VIARPEGPGAKQPKKTEPCKGGTPGNFPAPKRIESFREDIQVKTAPSTPAFNKTEKNPRGETQFVQM
jgi:hypothetical protein